MAEISNINVETKPWIRHVAVIARQESLKKWQKEFGSQVDGVEINIQPCQQNYFTQEYFIATISFLAPVDFEYWDDLE